MGSSMERQQKKELELYVHIPFCVRKCAYCDFLSAPAAFSAQEVYINALKKEIENFPYSEEYRVTTVFFGGGTPSILPEEWLCGLLELMRRKFYFDANAEVTVECNPGTVDAEKLRSYRKAGINRLSIGLQSADNRELALLGRIHSWEDFCRTYELARAAGFTNINVDLMSALPGQTVSTWEQTLRRVLEKAPEHISAYSLIVEKGTPFYERYHSDVKRRDRGEKPEVLPSEEEERRMYELTEQLLAGVGMHRYEISNYARPGYECRHNKGYWQGIDYAGFGLGASSLLRPVRYRNPEGMQDYLAGDFSKREEELLTREDQMEEFMFLGLRLTQGVLEKEFSERFGAQIDAVYGDVLRRQENLGLLKRDEGRICLTPRGLDLSNAVMAEFLF
ncbi:MAG: radical SAM family heme chaperone HemW [Lachnospiraceae bacterium]|nr:radical SAM family heme chaperone HemW [Lachnospiraceae bacterium]